MSSIIERAREVLGIEADAVLKLRDKIGASFEQAVEMILSCKGRVIITGMGKPGIIGRKISATLASTGTPSLVMHAADAIHGDLGMVTKDDIVIVISNSGKTEEITRLLPIIKKIGARLIAMTGDTNSPLSEHSDCVLDCSVEAEACPFNMAPTASTTAALALGDALAVVLLERRGFRLEDYAFYHPGGALGRQLLRVSDVMRTGARNPIVSEDALVREALMATSHARAGAAVIVDETERLVGIFTDGDLRRSIEKDPELLSKPVKNYMTRSPLAITPDKLVAEAVRLIKTQRKKDLPVVDEHGKPVGFVDEQDLLGM
ncbi:MAG: KpsF/GutQ family sugar-phosphate isomerase [Candidatus Abyssobacteria bacterium SURF_17]|jgi:arabinose-5-phosphate isomerase|uniref:KpsF/GutQ family sugar-phosphate isomerase n=1 Tax=Candidatus Abyssobacteria bacterium SURF_17 TaxID=2093361 RepID=A0A419F4A6_9BACT|nr:MAG: KpsF/GutQ family sugar-phosphate isomerase [Candidatus Abyssubacteria bacterium SURF_17]